MYKVITAATSQSLEKLMEGYTVSDLGSLTITNGQFYQSFLGVAKAAPATKVKAAPVEKPKKSKGFFSKKDTV